MILHELEDHRKRGYYGRTISGTAYLYSKRRQSREQRREAQHNNIMAAKAVAAAVRTTLGPQGYG